MLAMSILGAEGDQQPELGRHLHQLSALTKLVDLELVNLPEGGIPGGVPSQLVQPTSLRVSFLAPCDVREKFQHLSTPPCCTLKLLWHILKHYVWLPGVLAASKHVAVQCRLWA